MCRDPLSLAIGIASGVASAVGLVAAIVGSVVCALFGGTRLAVSGRGAAMAILVGSIVAEHGLACFISRPSRSSAEYLCILQPRTPRSRFSRMRPARSQSFTGNERAISGVGCRTHAPGVRIVHRGARRGMTPKETREDFVRRLFAFEARAATNGDERVQAAAALFERIFGVLAPIIGADAVDAIFTRSVRLTKRDHPCLELGSTLAHRVDPRLCLGACWREDGTFADVVIALYTRFLTSIDVLIGERLASRIIESAWRDMDGIDVRTATEEEKKG